MSALRFAIFSVDFLRVQGQPVPWPGEQDLVAEFHCIFAGAARLIIAAEALQSRREPAAGLRVERGRIHVRQILCAKISGDLQRLGLGLHRILVEIRDGLAGSAAGQQLEIGIPQCDGGVGCLDQGSQQVAACRAHRQSFGVIAGIEDRGLDGQGARKRDRRAF
jgi:hypothetical protein